MHPGVLTCDATGVRHGNNSTDGSSSQTGTEYFLSCQDSFRWGGGVCTTLVSFSVYMVFLSPFHCLEMVSCWNLGIFFPYHPSAVGLLWLAVTHTYWLWQAEVGDSGSGRRRSFCFTGWIPRNRSTNTRLDFFCLLKLKYETARTKNVTVWKGCLSPPIIYISSTLYRRAGCCNKRTSSICVLEHDTTSLSQQQQQQWHIGPQSESLSENMSPRVTLMKFYYQCWSSFTVLLPGEICHVWSGQKQQIKCYRLHNLSEGQSNFVPGWQTLQKTMTVKVSLWRFLPYRGGGI